MAGRKKQLYIHAGYYKTGTTALQSFCSDNATLLKKQGVNYVHSGRVGTIAPHNHCCLVFDELHRAQQTTARWYDYQATNWNSVRDEIESSKEQKHLISTEDFLCLTYDEPRRAILKSIYQNHLQDYDIKIIFYLRRPDRYLESWYAQLMKSGVQTEPLSVMQGRAFHPIHRDFSLAINSFADVFGEDGIVVRVYSDEIKRAGIFQDFFETIGEPYERYASMCSRWLEKHSRKNVTMPPVHIEIMRTFNSSYPERTVADSRRLESFLPKIRIKEEHRGVQQFLRPDDRRLILKELQPRLDEISRKYCNGKLLFAEPDYGKMTNDIINLSTEDQLYYLAQLVVLLLHETQAASKTSMRGIIKNRAKRLLQKLSG